MSSRNALLGVDILLRGLAEVKRYRVWQVVTLALHIFSADFAVVALGKARDLVEVVPLLHDTSPMSGAPLTQKGNHTITHLFVRVARHRRRLAGSAGGIGVWKIGRGRGWCRKRPLPPPFIAFWRGRPRLLLDCFDCSSLKKGNFGCLVMLARGRVAQWQAKEVSGTRAGGRRSPR